MKQRFILCYNIQARSMLFQCVGSKMTFEQLKATWDHGARSGIPFFQMDARL